MKAKALGLLALAAGLTGLAGQASAQAVPCTDASVYTAIANLPADRIVYLSGASAPQAFLSSVISGLYQGANTGTIDLTAATNNNWCAFYDRPATGGTAGALYRAFFGRLTGTAAGFPNQFVLFINRAKGGSVFGVNPVARAESIGWLNPTAAKCNPAVGTGTTGSPILCDETGNDLTGVDGRVPDFGVSDVAPYMFKDPLNVEFGANQLTPAESARFGTSIKPINELMMGYAVTRRQTTSNPAGIGNIVTADIIPPSYKMTKSRYAAMLSGQLRSWSSQGQAAPPGGDQVVVCRRPNGSGTQTSYNWYFNNFPCSVGNITGQSGAFPPSTMADSDGYNDGDSDGFPDSCWNGTSVVDCSTLASPGAQTTPYVIDVAAGYTTVENTSSGIVRDCMSRAANGGVHLFADAGGKWFRIDFGAGGYGAIAVLSLDSLNNAQYCTAGGTDDINAGWTFRHEDGTGETFNAGGRNTANANGCISAAPSYQTTAGSTGSVPRKGNLLCGGYEFSVEVTMQYRDPAVAGNVQPLTGNKKAFVDNFVQRAGDPANNAAEWVAAIPQPLIGRVPTTNGNVAAWTRANACSPIVPGDFTPYVNQCPAPNRPF